MPGVIDELFIEIRYRDDRRGLRRVRRRGVRAAQAIDQAFEKSANSFGQNFQRAGRNAQRSVQRLERQVDNSTGRIDDHFDTMAVNARTSQERIAADGIRQSGRFQRAWQGASGSVGSSITGIAGAIGVVGAAVAALGAQLESAQAGRALLTGARRAQADRLDREVGDRASIAPDDIARAVTRLQIGLGTREFEDRDVLNAAQLSSLLTAQQQELDQRTIGQAAVLAERIGVGLAPVLQTILDIGQQTGIDPNFIQEQAFEGAQTAGVQNRQQFEQFLSAAVSEVIRTGDVARLVQVGDEILAGPRDNTERNDPNRVTRENQAAIAARQGIDIRIRGQDEIDELIASMIEAQEAIGPINAAFADARTAFAPLIGIVEIIARLFSSLPGPIQSVIVVTGALGITTIGLNAVLGTTDSVLLSRVIPAMAAYARTLFSRVIPANLALNAALLTNPIILIGAAIAAVIVGLILLERRFGFLTAIFNKFRRAFSFIPGITAPDEPDDEDEGRAPRGGSAGGRGAQAITPSSATTTPIVPSAVPQISAAVPRVAPGPGNRVVINVPNLQVFNDITLDGAGDPSEVAAALEDVTGERVRTAIGEIADERIQLDNARVLSLTPRNRTI